METAGHLQFKAVSDQKGVALGSPHVALTTNATRVESVINQPSPPHPVLAPQSNGSEKRKKYYLKKILLKVKFNSR
jgi:hypothetical protein